MNNERIILMSHGDFNHWVKIVGAWGQLVEWQPNEVALAIGNIILVPDCCAKYGVPLPLYPNQPYPVDNE